MLDYHGQQESGKKKGFAAEHRVKIAISIEVLILVLLGVYDLDLAHVSDEFCFKEGPQNGIPALSDNFLSPGAPAGSIIEARRCLSFHINSFAVRLEWSQHFRTYINPRRYVRSWSDQKGWTIGTEKVSQSVYSPSLFPFRWKSQNPGLILVLPTWLPLIVINAAFFYCHFRRRKSRPL